MDIANLRLNKPRADSVKRNFSFTYTYTYTIPNDSFIIKNQLFVCGLDDFCMH